MKWLFGRMIAWFFMIAFVIMVSVAFKYPAIFLPVMFGFCVIFYLFKKYTAQQAKNRELYILDYTLPTGLLLKFIKTHPTLTLADAQLVDKAMRQYFLTYHHSKYRYVSMPSEVVDDLWHAFILHTQSYANFCKQAFGKFFHHNPAVVVGTDKQSNEGLRRTWWFACKQENINPKKADRLPLLFAIDAQLNIKDGRTYALNCDGNSHLAGGNTCCVGDFSSSNSSGCGGGSGCSGGFNDSVGDSGSSDGGGDSSGCGGGCGGGD